MEPLNPIRNALRRPFTLDLVWTVLPASIMTGGMALMPLRSWDYWWHLAMGRVVSQTGSVVSTNGFLYTMPADSSSFVQPWLSQWLLYHLHESVGLAGVLAMRTALVGAVVLILTLWSISRANNAMNGALVVCAGLPFLFFTVTERTHLFAWPLLVGLILLGYLVRSKRMGLKTLLAFPLATIAWVNLHGTFIFPALICFAFFAAEFVEHHLEDGKTDNRRWGFLVAMILSIAATFLNPRGADVYTYMFAVAGNPEMATVTEWMATTPFFPTGYGTLFYVLLGLSAVLMVRGRKEIDFADVFLLAGFALIAMRQSRGLLWFGFVMPIVVAKYAVVSEKKHDVPSPLMSKVNAAIGFGLPLLSVMLIPTTDFHRHWLAQNQFLPVRQVEPYLGIVPQNLPVAAVELIAADSAAKIFNPHQYSGYLLYRLQKAQVRPMVFVDHRIELPPERIWRSQGDVSVGEVSALDEFGVTWVVASREEQPALITALESRSSRWERVLENAHNVTFRRRSISNPTSKEDAQQPRP